MKELNKIIDLLIKEKGGSREDYLSLLNKIGFHESRNEIDKYQVGGGPGRGKYQFEVGKYKGGKTAANRTKALLKKNGITVPDWLKESDNSDSFDASKLPEEAQDLLFLGNMRGHPKADFSKIWKGEETIPEFWANYHWAGNSNVKPLRMKQFENSMSDYKEPVEKKIEVDNVDPEKDELLTAIDNLYQRTSSYNKIPNNSNLEGISMPDIDSFKYGGSIRDITNNSGLNSYNNGGTHEENPNGGIPLGVGIDGKHNTVEEGETSFDINGSKFIFSNRINVDGSKSKTTVPEDNSLALGGPVDPPTKTVDKKGVDFASNWFAHPTTRKKYAENTGVSLENSHNILNESIINMQKAGSNVHDYHEDGIKGKYSAGAIDYYGDPSEKTAVHERTHATGGLDKTLSNYIKDNYGSPFSSIRKKYNVPDTGEGTNLALSKEFGLKNTDTYMGAESLNKAKEHLRYLSTNGELYPRVMEIRQELDLSPGESVTPEMLKKLDKEKFNDLFRIYNIKDVSDILNKVATNNSINKNKYVV